MNGWRYWWRRWLGWVPLQWCMVCGHAYWGGLPRPGWRPWYQDYCSRKCCDEDPITGVLRAYAEDLREEPFR